MNKEGGRRTCAILAAAAALAAPPAAARTLVSLTFDGAAADAAEARRLLDARGLKATFYVESGKVGTAGFLSVDALRALEAGGHEVGGSTTDGTELVGVSTGEATRQVCAGREALRGWGLSVASFAFPYGSHDAAAERVARECGYRSARAAGGLACPGCPVAEPLPPADLYELPTAGSARSNSNVEELEAPVVGAERSGGGWVLLDLRRVCKGCETYSIRPATLERLLDWLAARASAGTVVETVGQVVAESAPAAQAAAPPAPSPALPAHDAAAPKPLLQGGTVTLERLPLLSSVRIATLSGRWVNTLDAPSGTALWDLKDAAGQGVPAGLYVYTVTAPGAERREGVLTVNR